MRHICDGFTDLWIQCKKINHEVVNNWICSYSFMSKDASGI